MTKPVRSVRVWVPTLGDGSGPVTYGDPPYYVTFYLTKAAGIRQHWSARQLVRATLTIDPPKPKKRRAKR